MFTRPPIQERCRGLRPSNHAKRTGLFSLDEYLSLCELKRTCDDRLSRVVVFATNQITWYVQLVMIGLQTVFVSSFVCLCTRLLVLCTEKRHSPCAIHVAFFSSHTLMPREWCLFEFRSSWHRNKLCSISSHNRSFAESCWQETTSHSASSSTNEKVHVAFLI
ncbi:hypothetical protein BS17DRAFT_106327 [Gyrodon lividus]|nr:hypothetical protein BS17DRAFT_106327 [Gyrodon lividus]